MKGFFAARPIYMCPYLQRQVGPTPFSNHRFQCELKSLDTWLGSYLGSFIIYTTIMTLDMVFGEITHFMR